jgi:hypothetical protein
MTVGGCWVLVGGGNDGDDIIIGVMESSVGGRKDGDVIIIEAPAFSATPAIGTFGTTPVGGAAEIVDTEPFPRLVFEEVGDDGEFELVTVAPGD